MFDYNLDGKHVLLSLDKEFLKYVKHYGIKGSPLFALVHKTESDGMWLETQNFKLAPKGIPQKINKDGKTQLKAHIFVPSKAIISTVVFPSDTPQLDDDPELYHIGFRPKKKKKAKRKKRR
ncbi:MAG: hypothetical protein COB53_10085 [Elusimicrobia bacterium]|nr:MAG: hypothetical protein COB53_10085 [Elusimicrobiota bacterium]